MSVDFHLEGMYRVQSRRRAAPSALAGRWMEPAAGLLDSAVVNDALMRHRAWRGVTKVLLQPAWIARREGTFRDEPDILYKREFFTPTSGGEMAADIVDVRKSTALWRTRRGALSRVVTPNAVPAVEAHLGDLGVVVANEYFCHEAGHMLGHDVLTKYARGYFRLQGATLWPLVFVEELRADLHAFGFALQLLPPDRASAIFLYNVMLRFGVHAAAAAGGKAYGTVPYLLFHLLTAHDFITVEKRNRRAFLRLHVLDRDAALEAMRVCAEHAERELTEIELFDDDLGASAIHAARYHRARIEDDATRASFASVFGGAP
jgi:hypothetical protein